MSIAQALNVPALSALGAERKKKLSASDTNVSFTDLDGTVVDAGKPVMDDDGLELFDQEVHLIFPLTAQPKSYVEKLMPGYERDYIAEQGVVMKIGEKVYNFATEAEVEAAVYFQQKVREWAAKDRTYDHWKVNVKDVGFALTFDVDRYAEPSDEAWAAAGAFCEELKAEGLEKYGIHYAVQPTKNFVDLALVRFNKGWAMDTAVPLIIKAYGLSNVAITWVGAGDSGTDVPFLDRVAVAFGVGPNMAGARGDNYVRVPDVKAMKEIFRALIKVEAAKKTEKESMEA